MTKISIIIPTYNRYGFLKRILKYYVSNPNSHNAEFIIVDSSDTNESFKVKKLIEGFKNTINVKYLWAQPGNIELAKYKASLLAVAPYVLYSGDDDIIIIEAAMSCARFLEGNPKYIAATGHGIVFGEKPGGRIVYSKYNLASVEANSPVDRVTMYLGNYFPPWFVWRISDYREIMILSASLELEHFREISMGALCALKGNIKQLPLFYVAREVHGNRHSSGLSSVSVVDLVHLEQMFIDLLVKYHTQIEYADYNYIKSALVKAYEGYKKSTKSKVNIRKLSRLLRILIRRPFSLINRYAHSRRLNLFLIKSTLPVNNFHSSEVRYFFMTRKFI